MNRTKSRILIIVTIVIWLIGLFWLTPIIGFATNRNLKKADIDLDIGEETIIYNIDSVFYSNNIFKDVTIGGWAFIENEGDNPDKRMSLVFSSGDQSYEFEMITIDRFDLRIAPILADYKVPISRNGFEGTFSPLLMKNGTYRLYLYVRENDSLFGITDTGRSFIKKHGSFTESVGGEKIRKVDENFDSSITVNTHFLCSIEDSVVSVKGWAFVEDGASKSIPSQPIIKLLKPDGTISYFSTVSQSRIDVVQAFDDKNLMLSGFSAEISTSSIGSGDNILSVVFDDLGVSSYTCTVAR